MIDEIEFVCGAVAAKDIITQFKFLQIKDSFVTAYNGEMAMGSPILFNIDCNPNAEQLLKLMRTLNAMGEENVSFHLSPNGSLKVKARGLRATIDCYQSDVYAFPPTEEIRVPLENGRAFIRALSTLLPFVSDDATRGWSRGVLCQNGRVYATNNVALMEILYEGNLSDEIIIPKKCAEELVSRNEIPVSFSSNEYHITFYYENGSFIHTQLITAKWPKDPKGLLDMQYEEVIAEWFTSDKLVDALLAISTLIGENENVYFDQEGVRSNVSKELGTFIEINDLGINCPQTIIFNTGVISELCKLNLTVKMRGDNRSIIFDNDSTIRAVIMAKMR